MNIYKDLSLEFGYVLETTTWSGKAPLIKVRIPILMPLLDNDKVIDSSEVSYSKGHYGIDSKNKTTLHKQNYLELSLPRHLYPDPTNSTHTLEKDTKLIIGFVDGKLDDGYIRILRVKED